MGIFVQKTAPELPLRRRNISRGTCANSWNERVVQLEPQAWVWLLRMATLVPDNDRWLLAPEARNVLRDSLARSALQAQFSLESQTWPQAPASSEEVGTYLWTKGGDKISTSMVAQLGGPHA